MSTLIYTVSKLYANLNYSSLQVTLINVDNMVIIVRQQNNTVVKLWLL